MSEILGTITGFAGNFAPNQWAYCDGGQISAASAPGYVELVGNSFGGDGVNNAATPHLADLVTQSGPSVKKIVCVNGSYYPDNTSPMAIVGQAVVTERLTQNGIWLECDGQSLDTGSNSALFSLLGDSYGGDDGPTFNLPNILPETALDGGPSVDYLIAAKGVYSGSYPYYGFIGQIQYNSQFFNPPGWVDCNGSTLLITQFSKLFNVLGPQYGGNGISTFALPELPYLQAQNGDSLRPIICVDGLFPQHPY